MTGMKLIPSALAALVLPCLLAAGTSKDDLTVASFPELGLTLKLLRQEEAGERILILISDGEANAGELAATDAAEMARDTGLRIFTIGFAEEIATQNATHLAELAETTGGQFRAATHPALIRDALSELDALAPVVPEETAAERRQDWRWLALAVALACLAAVGWQEHRDP